jgi:cytochrome c oxidase cbb3-type subunit I
MKYTVEIVGISLAAFFALVGAALAHDSLFQVQMWLLFFMLAGGAILLLRRHSFAPAPAVDSAHLVIRRRAQKSRQNPRRGGYDGC